MAIAENKKLGLPLVIAYTEVEEEHPDNKRFLSECEQWFGQEIVIIRNEKYNASINEVFRKERYLVGAHGAACTRLLKRAMRIEFQQFGDRQVFGYTAEERTRVDRFLDANAEVDLWPLLIENGLTKDDCLAIIARAGIELPEMYKLNYRNNNCIGCVKGGAGYWNKVRVDFPLVYVQRAKQERLLGVAICKLGGKRVFLDELPPDAGDYASEPNIQCGIFCELAELNIASS